ncbi:hypothetical protein AAVH_11247 [Aphelenchoides avenae]|nr:hypothetical protein AAVH_11247 [Aphelenchus avenae]
MSSDLTANDLREWQVDRTNWTLCKIGVIVSWAIDFFITTTVAIILAGSVFSPKGPSVGTTYAFSLFIFLFVGLSAAFVVYHWTGHATCLSTAGMIVLAQLLCVVYVASFFLTGARMPQELDSRMIRSFGCKLVLAVQYSKQPSVVDMDPVEKPPKTSVCVEHPGFHYPYF